MADHDDEALRLLDELEGEEEFLEDCDPSLQNIIDERSLKWIFVGGKGGVGKTTVSSSVAVMLSRVRKNVLIISTDPAHNLSDAFSQKFSSKPTPIDGFDNLFGMEVSLSVDSEGLFGDFLQENQGLKGLISDLGQSMPGMDEFQAFLEIMKQVKAMQFEVVVFDTAPTGHTLRLLAFPDMIEKSMGRLMGGNLQQMMSQFGNMFPNQSGSSPTEKLQEARTLIESIRQQFRDPSLTTFICVCIPEFLSVYETERLVQELTKFNIDSHNVVVNQLVFKHEGESECRMCNARIKIQRKYLDQIFDLYRGFHITQVPLLTEEVRGPDALKEFSKMLVTPIPNGYGPREE